MVTRPRIAIALIGVSLVAVAAVAMVLDPHGTDGTALALLGGWVTALVLGIVVFWWRAMLGGHAEVDRPGDAPPGDGVPPLAALRTWSDLASAMAVAPDERPTPPADESTGWPRVLWWMALVWTPAALLPIAFFWLRVYDVPPVGDAGRGSIAVVVVALCVYALAVGRVLAGRDLDEGEQEYLRPLGLAVEELPSIGAVAAGGELRPGPAGSAVMTGSRRGRGVRIELGDGRTTTTVDHPTEPFTVRSERGTLEAVDPVPTFVAEALRGLRTAARWEGIEVVGGAAGMQVTRSSTDGRSWLYDLWLLERFAEVAWAP